MNFQERLESLCDPLYVYPIDGIQAQLKRDPEVSEAELRNLEDQLIRLGENIAVSRK